ncbi:MAG: dihydrofolate reductase [Lachnospiraceae bacterium]|nr:dihydrofolate reductase [Lachnospiraceae bacterium]
MIMIVAADEKWGIGINGDLLTPLPEDMKFFREKTKDSVIIMGRKTLLSFPNGKPLKNRVNIVITTDKNFSEEGCIVCHTIEEAVEVSKNYTDKEVFVVGGGTVYRQMLKYCDTAYITKIFKTFDEADTFIDNLDTMEEWVVAEESELNEHNGLNFRFVTYKRK